MAKNTQDNPMEQLARRLVKASKSGDLKLSPSVLGDFNVLRQIFVGVTDAMPPSVSDVNVYVVRGQLNVVGTPGREVKPINRDPQGNPIDPPPPNENLVATPQNSKLVVTGKINTFDRDGQVTMTLRWNRKDNKPAVRVDYGLLPNPGEADAVLDIGELFSKLGLGTKLELKAPTVVASNWFALHDVNLDANVEKGLNFYGAIELKDGPNRILARVGDLLALRELALHAAITLEKNLIFEGSVQQVLPPFIDGKNVQIRWTRTDIGVEIKSAKSVDLSVAGDVVVKLFWAEGTNPPPFVGGENPTFLVFTGKLTIGLPEGSVTGSLTLNGTSRGNDGALTGKFQNATEWKDPFGFQGITIRSLALQLGFNAETVIDNIGIHGDLKFLERDGSISILVDVTDPDEFVLAGTINELTLAEIMLAAFFSPLAAAAYQAIPAAQRAGIQKVLDGKLEDVEVMIVPKPTSIGQIEFRDTGIVIAGKLTLWGWKSQLQVNVDYWSGMFAHGEADPLHISVAGQEILSFTGASGGKPSVTLAIGTSRKGTQFKISGKLAVLGVTDASVDIQADRNGLVFDVELDSSPIRAGLACTFADWRFGAKGGSQIRIPPVTVGPLKVRGLTVMDSISLSGVDVEASLVIQAVNGESFSLSLQQASFRYGSSSLSVPTFTVTQPLPDFRAVAASLAEFIRSNAQQIFKSAISTAEQWAETVGTAGARFAGDAATVLKSAYNTTPDEAAKIMDHIGLPSAQIARSLSSVYGLGADGVAGAMKAAGFGGQAVADGLKQGLNLSERAAAEVLKGARFPVNQIPHVDQPAITQHTDIPHADTSGPHIDLGVSKKVFGKHIDTHTDSRPHLDTPRVNKSINITPHVDIGKG